MIDSNYVEAMEHHIRCLEIEIHNDQNSISERLELIEHDKKSIEIATKRRVQAIADLEKYKANNTAE